MYKVVAQELVGIGEEQRFIGEARKCRFCGTSDSSDFGKKTNAHAFPEGLGNKTLFSLGECCSCNSKFSRYEDALCKAVGPYLTLGGVKGKNGVRQTGRSGSVSVLKHQNDQGKRHIQIEARNIEDIHSVIKKNNELLRFRIPIDGDKFVPRYAYKAILKIALSLLPVKELCLYRQNLECLQEIDDAPGDYPLRVGFSYASIGNAPPTLGCIILQRKNDSDPIPYIIAMFQAGSVCFQIAPRSEEKDRHISNVDALGIVWTTQLAKPEGGFFPIEYSSPIQFDWSGLKPQLQPFEAFELMFNAHTTQGAYRPLARRSDQ